MPRPNISITPLIGQSLGTVLDHSKSGPTSALRRLLVASQLLLSQFRESIEHHKAPTYPYRGTQPAYRLRWD